MEKVHNFLAPASPQDVLEFFEVGKNLKFDNSPLPPPSLGWVFGLGGWPTLEWLSVTPSNNTMLLEWSNIG